MPEDELAALDDPLDLFDGPSERSNRTTARVVLDCDFSEMRFETTESVVENDPLHTQTSAESISYRLADGTHATGSETIVACCYAYKPGQENPLGCGPLGEAGAQRCRSCLAVVCRSHSQRWMRNGTSIIFCDDCQRKITISRLKGVAKKIALFPIKLLVDFIFPRNG